MRNINDKLKEFHKGPTYPFHMPGHKRKALLDPWFQNLHPYEWDYTEIDGLDDLHEPEEMFRKSMDEMKEFYHTKETFFLVNGSTSGIMAAIAAICDLHDKIILSRNCHKSVYFAVELLGLTPVYIYPEVEEENGTVIDISCEQLQEIVDKHPDAKGVVLVSPTYEGKVMRVQELSKIVKGANMTLIVDEAHGAHFPFGEKFPKTAIELGADFVIQSLHKTMPALTQTSILHVCGDGIDVKKAQSCIDYFETSSPSYLLIASMEHAIDYGMNNKEEFDHYHERLCKVKKQLDALKHLYLLEVDDIGKLVISTAKTEMTGKQLYDILLNNYGLQMEMAQESYCLAMTSIYDEWKDLQRLIEVLFEIDARLHTVKKEVFHSGKIMAKQKYIPYEAKRSRKREVCFEESLYQTSGEYVYLYPPGIPLLVPGEIITKECIEKIKEYKQKGLAIKGLSDSSAEKIYVLMEQGE